MTPTPRLRRSSVAVLPALGALAALAAASCGGDPLSPSALAGRRYALDRAGDDRVPIVAWVSGRDTSQLLGDTIIFGAAPKATRVLAWRYAWGDSAPRRETYRVELEYRVSGGQVEVGWFTPCGPLALCAPNLIGPATAAELHLVPNNGLPSPTSVYRRADVVF